VLFAVAFNFWFPWRRYPARFHHTKSPAAGSGESTDSATSTFDSQSMP
jgi:hypothetical protein